MRLLGSSAEPCGSSKRQQRQLDRQQTRRMSMHTTAERRLASPLGQEQEANTLATKTWATVSLGLCGMHVYSTHEAPRHTFRKSLQVATSLHPTHTLGKRLCSQNLHRCCHNSSGKDGVRGRSCLGANDRPDLSRVSLWPHPHRQPCTESILGPLPLLSL